MFCFQKNKKIIFILGIIFLLLIFSFIYRLFILKLDKKNYLAQIISIETNLLKNWQQSNGFRNIINYGDSGNDVILLQKILSQDPEIYPEQKITGYYGDLTRQAVLKFQKQYNLTQTGFVDIATRNKLNEILLSFLCPEQKIIYPEFYLKKLLIKIYCQKIIFLHFLRIFQIK